MIDGRARGGLLLGGDVVIDSCRLVPVGRRCSSYLKVVGELGAAGVPRVHGDERAACVYQVKLRPLKDEALEAPRLRLLDAQHLLRPKPESVRSIYMYERERRNIKPN